MGQCRLLSGIQFCERYCERAQAARRAELPSTHLTRGVGFASLVDVPRPELSTHPACPHPQALLETALTRVVLPMPILVLPPIVMSMLEK